MLRPVANAIEAGELVLDGIRVFYRRVPGEGTPVVYCHGNPSHGEDWVPFMERGGPSIAIDMPGWGRSDHPSPDRFDYSMYGLSAFLERCLDELGVGRRKLVVHDWGSLALIGAQRRPDLIEKLAILNVIPLLPGYRWHWVAQIWRRRPFGEIANATTTRASMALTMRQAMGNRRPTARRAGRRGVGPLGQGHPGGHPCSLSPCGPQPPRRRGQEPRQAHLPGADSLGRP